MSEYQYYEFQTAGHRLSEKGNAGVAFLFHTRSHYAVQPLIDLKDLASRPGAGTEFSQRLAAFREMHSGKPALLRRLREKDL